MSAALRSVVVTFRYYGPDDVEATVHYTDTVNDQESEIYYGPDMESVLQQVASAARPIAEALATRVS